MTEASSYSPAEDRHRFGSAAEYAYEAMRAGIISGHFRPGHRMREIQLSEWLRVSRTPVRQALSRLELEGLLDLRPRYGLVVSSPDDQVIEELYEMRGVLEAAAASMAAMHASERDLVTLRDLIASEAKLPDDPVERYRHNLQFHQALYKAAHNRFLLKSLGTLNDTIGLLGPTTMATEGRAAKAHEEHSRIVAAIESRDASAAHTEARSHVTQALSARRSMRANKRDPSV